MLRAVVLLSLVACALAGALSDLKQGHIVGGENVDIANYPWQISLQKNGQHRCGGSIASESVIVTAAHCVDGLKSAAGLTIYAGSSQVKRGGVRIAVQRFLIHPEYNKTPNNADVALLYLSSPLTYSKTIKPIAMHNSVPAVGSAVTVTGWGLTFEGSRSPPSALQGVTVNLVSNRSCKWKYLQVNDNMLCASVPEGGKDSCQGDSGGPLVYQNALLGVVSFGKGCAREGMPGVYASVPALKSWIVKNM